MTSRGLEVARPYRASELAIALVARPLLLMFWVFILWGTLYAAALVYAIATEGAGVWRRTLSGDDPLGGTLSLVAAGLAIVVWSTLGIIAWVTRAGRRKSERQRA